MLTTCSSVWSANRPEALHASAEGSQIIAVCAEIEAELSELEGEEKKAFLADLGIEESKEYETLAGYVIYHHEGIPSAGEIVSIAGKQIKILRTSQSRIDLVKIKVQ